MPSNQPDIKLPKDVIFTSKYVPELGIHRLSMTLIAVTTTELTDEFVINTPEVESVIAETIDSLACRLEAMLRTKADELEEWIKSGSNP